MSSKTISKTLVCIKNDYKQRRLLAGACDLLETTYFTISSERFARFKDLYFIMPEFEKWNMFL